MKLFCFCKRLIEKLIINYMHPLINSCIYVFYRNPILLSSWVDIRFGKIINRNWGDDINVYLLEKISKRKVVVINQSLLHRKSNKENFICIGSILGLYENENSIIWGAGFIDENKNLLCKPKRISSVRGKYTRNILLSQGHDCPPIYGDPALLISRYYRPSTLSKPLYKIGFILHYVDATDKVINSYVQSHKDCLLISLSDYEKWTDVVDQICSCEYILSSSLHGIIVSDSYGIANAWVRVSEKIVGGNFKYIDYFSSVGREDISPYRVSSYADIENLYLRRSQYKKVSIDYTGILKSCPFL